MAVGASLAILTGCTSATEAYERPATESNTQFIDISGYWEGVLVVPRGTDLVLGFSLSGQNNRYESTLSVPQQGIKSMDTSATVFDDGKLTIVMEALQATFTGTICPDGDGIAGTFSQRGYDIPLTLKKKEPPQPQQRIQDPVEPFPYVAEDVRFLQHPLNFMLAGTITRPPGDGPYPAVVLVSGSGSQNRDEEIMGHRPFLVLADALTRAGIVVLRYDDRGFAQSEGNAATATTVDLADDAESAVEFLRTQPYVDSGSIGIIGHSEGGIIGPIVAQRNSNVSFLVLMAGSGVSGISVLEDQTAAVLRAQGAPEEMIEHAVDMNMTVYHTILDESLSIDERKLHVSKLLRSAGLGQNEIEAQLATLFSPWYRAFLTLDPSSYLQKTDIPVLILTGTKDTQVSYSLHVPAIESALEAGGNSRFTTHVYEGLNHLFQPAATGTLEEYAVIETTIDPWVIQDIIHWILVERHQL